ncbi:Peptidyl-prolyl cis-trans isomerase NIMA-interacting protein 1 [Coemansia spiralis]|uniref:Peptidyl-prolyl cis-trans isomerase n=1 Tax=Coemansia spiralis TaxID=417178 RepID=A0A9W8GMM4_9FUNG|nr:Peptidyl-prolyl cis-trans isomerase NIMA-interacting protein 1 [Coemansia spiralis]
MEQEQQQQQRSALPPNWEVRTSKSRGMDYYFNRVTGESVWEPPSAEKEVEMRASHILAKHIKSRNPMSWKKVPVERTPEEAEAKVRDLRQQIIGKPEGDETEEELEARIPAKERLARFGKLAAEESDCSSARHNGDLGFFGRGKMQKAFEQAVLSLKVGQISGPVKSDSGYHIIFRTK